VRRTRPGAAAVGPQRGGWPADADGRHWRTVRARAIALARDSHEADTSQLLL